jgi:hypothetical protein
MASDWQKKTFHSLKTLDIWVVEVVEVKRMAVHRAVRVMAIVPVEDVTA